uniref:Uncharacterized protein n=1 Tax=Panagrolaimus sp. ES5 TaxID=591445 RepID=A0AC34GX32_9BILA
MPPISFIIFVILILSTFSSSATESTSNNRSINCYKYERNFTDVNFIDPPAEEKDVTKCDQCFSYLCYSNGEYTLGYGCREDFFQSCNISDLHKGYVLTGKKTTGCADLKDYKHFFDMCLQDYCSHKRMHNCIDRGIKGNPSLKIGPVYTVGNITFTQLTTPSPTTATTPSIPTPQSADGNHGGSQMVTKMFLDQMLQQIH